jgi:hypothetical protein
MTLWQALSPPLAVQEDLFAVQAVVQLDFG